MDRNKQILEFCPNFYKILEFTPYEDDNETKAEWLRAYRFLEYYNNEITYNGAVEIDGIYMEGMKKNREKKKGIPEASST